MWSKAGAAVIASPGLPSTALVLGASVYWAADEGGIAATRWPPAALFLVLLGVVALYSARLPAPANRLTALAAALLAAYAGWSFASIAWVSALLCDLPSRPGFDSVHSQG